jgi:choline dehydrogenase
MPNELEADFVVVGSGAGGGPLAARLALAGFDVLVLEAGSDNGASLTYQVPALHGRASEDPAMSWQFFVQHYADKARQTSVYDPKYDEKNGGIFYPRAGTLGGCTAHNAMITVYPHNSDWDALAVLTGDESWRPARMRSYFERLERCAYRPPPAIAEFNPTRHGFGGWLGTQQADPAVAVGDPQLLKVIFSAVVETFLDRLIEDQGSALDVLRTLVGSDPLELVSILAQHQDPREVLKQLFWRQLDPNDWSVTRGRGEGVFAVPLATAAGHRNGPREFLRETAQRPGMKLRIETEALATRVLLDANGTATGVEFLKGAHLYRADPGRGLAGASVPWTARARREVILAGGTFNTPQLLMLSGIGPKEHLAARGIECRVALEGVGGNLQDRYEVGVVSEMKKEFGVLQGCGFRLPAAGDPPDPCLGQWHRDGTGLYATNGAVLAVIRRSRKDLPEPDLFLFGLPGTFKGYFIHYAEQIVQERNRFTWAILKGHTRNTAGTVRLRSKEPRDVPDINFHYFNEGSDREGGDLQAVVEGIKLVRRIMGHPSLAGLVTRSEILPGGDIRDDAAIAEAVKRSAWGHHACGTCKMGRKTADRKPPPDDLGAVVDGDFRVYGTRNLRVVDATVFPKIPGFFIVSSVYMISEKAADVIVAAAKSATPAAPASVGGAVSFAASGGAASIAEVGGAAPQVSGFPFWEVTFDEGGGLVDNGAVDQLLSQLPGQGVTDLFIFSHGWNNSPPVARALYQNYFAQLRTIFDQLGNPLPRRREANIGGVGVIWPSMRWIDEDPPAGGEGAASLGFPAAPSDTEVVLALKAVFGKPEQQQALDELAALLKERPHDPQKLARFQALMAQLTTGHDVAWAVEDNGERALLSEPPQDVFTRFAAVTPDVPDEGGVAGFHPFQRLWDGAKQALRQATYWEMKKRAGMVGEKGLGPLIGQIQQVQPELRVHLLGHSFGARLVSFALTTLPEGTASPVKSLLLLQGAFSHFAFAASLPHDPGRAGALDGMQKRVDGPLAVTHTLKDMAVGTFYPLASLAAGQDAAAFGDSLYRWGAMGHDGAQAVDAAVRILDAAGTDYGAALSAGRFVSLDGNNIIVNGGPPSGAHSDIIHPEIAWASLAVAGIAGPEGAPAPEPAGTGGGAGGVAAFPFGAPAAEPKTAPPPQPPSPQSTPLPSEPMPKSTASPAFGIPEGTPERERVGLKPTNREPGPVMVELNLMHAQGLPGAEKRFTLLFTKTTNRPPTSLRKIANTYFHCYLSIDEIRKILNMDETDGGADPQNRAIFHIWPDFPVNALIDRSIQTIKADAARRSFDASGMDITWAIIDSGIDRSHPHFRAYDTLGGDIGQLHWDFTCPYEPGSTPLGIDSAFKDDLGHGTHVGGIIAGSLCGGKNTTDLPFFVAEHYSVDSDEIKIQQRRGVDAERLAGVAPRCKLVSLKVIDRQGRSSSSNVIRALQHVREKINGDGKLMRIQGVNLSLGYEFDPQWFACGQSPICAEVDRLVRSGVVVVTAAGNTGYGELRAKQRTTNTGLSLTINDPGNAPLGITVGATHRDAPYRYGVSYFSSKGPTGDGRLKPDLVAPGEWITSCAAGQNLASMKPLLIAQYGNPLPANLAAYLDDSGTSMAAPHVSGAIAAFLSIRREFIGQAERVKDIFLNSATTLGRERYFEGKGLLDLMRAIQSV